VDEAIGCTIRYESERVKSFERQATNEEEVILSNEKEA
jgi:hypothetical protein